MRANAEPRSRCSTLVAAVGFACVVLAAAPAAAAGAPIAVRDRPVARAGGIVPAAIFQQSQGVSEEDASSADTPELARGMVGAAVTAWQEQLTAWRTGTGQTAITIDGIFGAVTEAATRNFQAASGLTTDGIVGPLTRAAMNGALQAPAPAPPPAPAPGSEPVLDHGSNGPAVMAWQEQLNEWRTRTGLTAIAADGVYGVITENATRNLQAAQDIAIDGIVGPQTRSALAQALASPAPEPPADAPVLGAGSEGAVVAAWQEQLNEWRTRTGLAAVAVDGVYGPITEEATRAFQSTAGVTVDGVVGPETRAALGAALR